MRSSGKSGESDRVPVVERGSGIWPDGTRGSVSIYFIAATAALVLITALLIDFARVAAFRKQSELAVKSGVRSVLSSFDPAIYARYGLFVRGGEPADVIFSDTVEGNTVGAGEDSGGFPYIDTRWEQTGVTESRPIADHGVFRRQVLEEMKYKAPIDLTIELARKLRGMSGMMADTARTVDALERMQKAYDLREAALDRVLERQRDHGEAIRRALPEEIPHPPVALSPVSATGTIVHIADVAMQYDDYVVKRLEDEARRQAIRAKEEAWRQRQEERKRLGEASADERSDGKAGGRDAGKTPVEDPLVIGDEEKPRYEAIVAAYESGVSDLAASLAADAAEAREDAEAALADAREAWLDAREANDEMARIAEEAAAAPTSIGAATSTSSEGASDSSVSAEQAEAMAELRRKAADMVLPASFFSEYETEIGRQRDGGLAIIGQAGSYSSSAASAVGSTGRGEALLRGADTLQRGYADFVLAYGAAGTVLSARQAMLQAHRAQDRERKAEEKKANAEWASAKQLLGLLSGRAGTPEERAEFDQLNKLFERNLTWNEEAKEQRQEEQADNPDQGRDEAISLSGDLLAIIEDILLGARDQLFFSEYAISRMSRYEPAYVRGMLRGEEAPLSVGAQQTEYILYGFDGPSGNIAAAYGEIFAFRLAIRTMEGFVECAKAGNPLLVLVAALVYGIRQAIVDLNTLVDTGSIPLSKYAKVPTTYADYLRLFLLLHGGSGNQLARMIAVMELETGVSFTEAYTYASGEATSSVRLWFFPGLVRMLGGQGGLGGKVNGNRYEATYGADMAYQ
ncbi:hypothetical protein [Cohnella sp. GCM10027633]|uniref:hypothetical protein n=1 Tax=unclassified Cohnella TaxID=2636738 RepID=UPI0036280145